MDICSLRPEQIQSLVDGKEIQIKYYTLEEYGYAQLHEVKLVPICVNSKMSYPDHNRKSPYDAGLGPLSGRQIK